MKIKSITDVITNSSDETYIIKNSGNSANVSSLFDKYMNKNHRDEWNSRGKYFKWTDMKPEAIADLSDGTVLVDWPVMCNLEDAESYLKSCFGEDNVDDAKCGKHPAYDEYQKDYWEKNPIDLSWLDKFIKK